MKLTKTNAIISLVLAGLSMNAFAKNEGKATVDFRLRYENVDQDNAKKDADALTLRTKLNYQTATFYNLSAVVEFEDSRAVAGLDQYNDTLGRETDHSVIADPESTELDQAFLQYKTKVLTTKLGRQVITLDNHRFVGHVGWRQDRQTFDAVSFVYAPSKQTKFSYSYIDQRNRIFSDEKDLDSKDHLINVSYQTKMGKLTAYSYLLEVDEGADNSLDTYGISYAGKQKDFSYRLEFASQESESGNIDYDADYFMVEGGYKFSGYMLKAGMESLGSDNSKYGFSTPLATLHKFNGWGDQFLSTPKEGLVDVYASLSGKAYKGAWIVAYHDYSADEDTRTVDDLGSELNMQYTQKFTKNYSGGIKYSNYSDGDSGAGKVDTDKFWIWVGAKF